MTFCACRSYRVWVNCCMPKDAPTMSSTNGTPNSAGYFLSSLLYAASFSEFLENDGIPNTFPVPSVEEEAEIQNENAASLQGCPEERRIETTLGYGRLYATCNRASLSVPALPKASCAHTFDYCHSAPSMRV